MADESKYLPGSVAEAVKIGGTAIAAIIIAKKFAPKQAASFGLSDGVWQTVKMPDGTTGVQWVPASQATAK